MMMARTNSSVTKRHTQEGMSEISISEEVSVIIQWIFFAAVCQIVGTSGVMANIINVICFIKQGFKDPVNVSLLGLAVSDLGCLVTLIWTNISLTPAFAQLDLPFDTIEVQHLVSGMPHTTFTRITGWITALITLERCLCITAPLKVKHCITTTRVSVIIIIIFALLIISVAPLYMVNRLGQKFDARRNKTILGLVFTSDRESVENVSFVINNVLIPFGAFMIVIICTVILVVTLNNKTKWRKTSTTSTQADNVSNRNQKVAKMVVMISILFIGCFVPISCGFIAMVVEPELTLYGKHRNILILIGALGFFLESINSSVNIFIYYHMSSKYRTVFRRLFLPITRTSNHVSNKD